VIGVGGKIIDSRRSAADRGEYRRAAGAIAESMDYGF